MEIEIAGSNALIVYFSQQIDAQAAARVAQLAQTLNAAQHPWLIDLVPSYSSLLVVFEPQLADHLQVRKMLRAAANNATQAAIGEARKVRLPVYYSEESGPDLAAVAERAGLSVDEVIAIHSSSRYQVYAIGFAPGFAYLGEVDPRIATPRLATPRAKVPRGAVAIADRQTAVYPASSPGGWNLIGRCPTPMFNPKQSPTMPVASGDSVEFYTIDKVEFLALGGEL